MYRFLLLQPCLFGEGIDSVTHVDLSKAYTGDGMNGELLWNVIKLYNDRMKSVCANKDIPLIDLAAKMPKNSLYYYDPSHFTNEGA